jgi:hypothetical protein
MVFAKTSAKLRMAMPEILENAENDLTPQMRNLLELLWRRVEDDRVEWPACFVPVNQRHNGTRRADATR